MSKEKQIEEMAKELTAYEKKLCERLPKDKCLLTSAVHAQVSCDYCKIAEFLVNAGYRKQSDNVIELPCKVGDTVWFNTFKKNATVCVGVQPHTIDRIDISLVCDTKNLIETHIHDWEIGKTVFLTKEEAEAKMKGGAE